MTQTQYNVIDMVFSKSYKLIETINDHSDKYIIQVNSDHNFYLTDSLDYIQYAMRNKMNATCFGEIHEPVKTIKNIYECVKSLYYIRF